MKPQCIIFDVDDTLYLQRDYFRSGLRQVHRWLNEEEGIAGFGPRAWQRFEAHGPRNLIARTLEEMGHRPDENLLREITRVIRSHEPAIELCDDARTCLERLYGDFILAILTTGPIPEQHAKTEKLELDQWCTPVVYAGQGGGPAPHRRALEEIERRSGLHGPGCLFVADHPEDFPIARHFQWQVARIRRPEALAAEIETPDEIPEFPDLEAFSIWLVREC